MPIYDSWDFGASTPWLSGTMIGTSLACPMWAGMISIADEGRAIAGQGSLDGPSQTLPALYQMPAADFHDITSGSNGPAPRYVAGTGYDLVTGIGSPVGNLLIPQLAGPSIVTAAAASPLSVNATTNLSVLGADVGGESTLTYTWAATTLPSGAQAPTFSDNTDNTAKNTTATFSAAGTYDLTVTITDAVGLSVTSSVSVTVGQTLTSITLSPASASLDATATQQFTATGYDQFGAALQPQPTFTWTTSVGVISTQGLLTASNVSASGTVTVTSGSISSGGSPVTVTEHAPTVSVPASASANPVPGTTTNLSVQGAEIDPDVGSLTYAWVATTLPSGAAAPTFSANDSNAAQNTTATFSAAGTYGFTVTITDPGGLSVTSSLSLTVNQTLTSFGITPPSGSGGPAGGPSFATAELDQFGNTISTAGQPQLPWSLNGDGGNGIDFDATTGATVSLDGASPSFTVVTFGGTGYTIGQQGSGGTLHLVSGTSAATLNVAASSSDTISAPLALDSNVTVVPAAGSQLNISGGVSGAGSLTVERSGDGGS